MSNETFELFDIPDMPELPNWLEQRLLGLDLRDLIIGLAAVNEDNNTSKTLSDICGSTLDAVSESGLKVLSEEQIRSLLKHPYTLLELQGHVLVNGGPYWDSIEPTPDDKRKFDASLESTISKLQKSSDNPKTAEPPTVKIAESTTKTTSLRNYWPLLALAAGILIAIGIWRPSASENGGGWGFDQSGLLAADVTGQEYMSRLSDAAGKFSKKIPDSRESTLKRLKEFKAGCEKLIAAPHRQLAKQEDREWLIKNCKSWLSRIEKHITDLGQGKKDWQEILSEADKTAKSMQEALLAKAAEVA